MKHRSRKRINPITETHREKKVPYSSICLFGAMPGDGGKAGDSANNCISRERGGKGLLMSQLNRNLQQEL